MTSTLFVIMRNEIKGLQTVLPRIKREWFDEVLLLDGGSTDGSIEYAESMGFKVTRQQSKGVLAGIKEGFKLIRTDIVLTYTPDNNMIPEKLPEILSKMREGYDMVICSRYLDGAKSYDDSMISGFGNWLFTSMVNVLFGAHYTDVLGFYRAYRTNLVHELGIEIAPSIDTQLCIRCVTHKKKVCEIPGDEPKRIGGKSSRSIIGHGTVELFTILGEFFSGGKP